MPAGRNLPVWTDQNEPKGDDPIWGGPFLWQHPSAGPVYVEGRGKMSAVSQDWFAANAASPVEEQGEALETGGAAQQGVPAPAPTPTPTPTPAPEGVTSESATATEANRARFTSGAARAREQSRAATESAVQAYEAEERRKAQDPMAGLSFTERAAAGELMRKEGIDELEAARRIREGRAAAEEQAEAIE